MTSKRRKKQKQKHIVVELRDALASERWEGLGGCAAGP